MEKKIIKQIAVVVYGKTKAKKTQRDKIRWIDAKGSFNLITSHAKVTFAHVAVVYTKPTNCKKNCYS